MTMQRRQAVGVWTYSSASDIWQPWDEEVTLSGSPVVKVEDPITISSGSNLEVTSGSVILTEPIEIASGSGVETIWDGAVPKRDSLTGALITIDYAHHEIHGGRGFLWTSSPGENSIGNDGTIDFHMLTGAGRTPHLVFGGESTGNALLQFFENPSASADGYTASPPNLNRQAPRESTVDCQQDPTVDDEGDLIDELFLAGGTGPKSIGGSVSRDIEWILDENTDYLIRIVNIAGSAKLMGLEAFWYEESV